MAFGSACAPPGRPGLAQAAIALLGGLVGREKRHWHRMALEHIGHQVGNAAGVISYCMKNNYLNADKAAQVKDQLLGKLGMQKQEEPKDTGFQNGLGGLVTGSNGKSFSIDKLKGDLKEKACDFVLNNAKSLI